MPATLSGGPAHNYQNLPGAGYGATVVYKLSPPLAHQWAPRHKVWAIDLGQ